jgi:tRNA1Val (adenine37-N6)-methyltransferase
VPLPPVPGAWQLTLIQGTAGYRFSLEAFLLADFVAATAPSPLLDLGTGCGVVALFLARRFPHSRVLGVELQASLAAVARQNVAHNGLAHQVDIVQADARCAHCLLPAGAFGTVVCNPPYRAVGSGRRNPNPEKAIARHELTLTLAQLVQACRHVLVRRGLLVLIYHPSRLAELCARLDTARLCPRRLRFVHATPLAPASLVLVEAVQGGRDALTVLPPLHVYEAGGRYTAEMQAIFQGRTLQNAPCGVQHAEYQHTGSDC